MTQATFDFQTAESKDLERRRRDWSQVADQRMSDLTRHRIELNKWLWSGGDKFPSMIANGSATGDGLRDIEVEDGCMTAFDLIDLAQCYPKAERVLEARVVCHQMVAERQDRAELLQIAAKSDLDMDQMELLIRRTDGVPFSGHDLNLKQIDEEHHERLLALEDTERELAIEAILEAI